MSYAYNVIKIRRAETKGLLKSMKISFFLVPVSIQLHISTLGMMGNGLL